jgi:hypothetical protein
MYFVITKWDVLQVEAEPERKAGEHYGTVRGTSLVTTEQVIIEEIQLNHAGLAGVWELTRNEGVALATAHAFQAQATSKVDHRVSGGVRIYPWSPPIPPEPPPSWDEPPF